MIKYRTNELEAPGPEERRAERAMRLAPLKAKAREVYGALGLWAFALLKAPVLFALFLVRPLRARWVRYFVADHATGAWGGFLLWGILSFVPDVRPHLPCFLSLGAFIGLFVFLFQYSNDKFEE